MPRVNSYTNWGRLEEVWLGDCYPAHFYDHLASEVRDVFYEITEKTQHDLKIIQRKLEEESDEDEDRIKIHTDSIDLGEMDVFDMNKTSSVGDAITLDGVEEL